MRGCGIIFGDAGLDLTHKVGADIGCLGVDAATHAGKERLGRRAHAEGEHGGGDHGHFLERIGIVDTPVEDKIPDGDVEEAEAHHHQTHHGSGAERHSEASVEAFTGGIGGARRGIGGCLHAEEARQT